MKKKRFTFPILLTLSVFLSMTVQSQELTPSSIPYPDYSVPGDTVSVAIADGRNALENAIANGGTVLLEAGTYDLTGWTAQPLSNIKIIGVGKGKTILRAGFEMTDLTNNSDNVFGAVSGRVVFEGLTFDKWRCVLLGAGGRFNDENGMCDDDALENLANSLPKYPNTFNDGIACKDVSFVNSGRVADFQDVQRNIDNQINNCYWFNCDFINLWYALYATTRGPCSNWHFYNCLFQDIILPDTTGNYRWDQKLSGVRLTHDPNVYSAGTSSNVRFEHCTFNGISSKMVPVPTIESIVGRYNYCIRLGNTDETCWLRHCKFRNIGWDKDGNRQCTMPRTSGLIYPKGQMKVEYCDIDRICVGGEGIFNNKGAYVSEKYEAGHTDTYTYQVRNVYIRDVEQIPASVRTDGGGTFTPRGVFFTTHCYNSVLDNVKIENAITRNGVFCEHYNAGVVDSLSIKNVTVKNLSVNESGGFASAVFIIGSTRGAPPYANIRLDNVDAELVSTPRNKASLLRIYDSHGDYASTVDVVEVTNARLDVSGSGVGDAILLEVDDHMDDANSPTPTGIITGHSGTAYAQYGQGVEDQTLTNSGTVTGATANIMAFSDVYTVMDWGSSKTHVGCHPVRVNSLVNDTIIVSSGTNGTISPAGQVIVPRGGDQTFTITPFEDYGVQDVLIDGISVGPVSSYTFTNVDTNHTISASFELLPGHTIEASAAPNGSIEPSGDIWVLKGDEQTFAITPDENYKIEDVLVDGISVGPVQSYTFNNVTEEHSIEVIFAAIEYTITATAGPNGTIEPSGDVTVVQGSTQEFTITPDDGYEIEDIQVNGVSIGALDKYPFSNVRSDHTISVSFSRLPTAINGGSVEDRLRVYPNPLKNGMLIVSFKDEVNLNTLLEVKDMTGKTVFMKNKIDPGTGKIEVDLGHLPSGVFFVQLSTDEKVYNKKLIKQ